MRPRRSRFSRIYTRLTRRNTRRRQWQQIAQLRPHGSVGHPSQSTSTSTRARAYARYEPTFEPAPEPTFEPPRDVFYADSDSLAFAGEEHYVEDHSIPVGGGVGVALLTIALFLLACAYAAFSGYMHSSNDGFAWLGIAGALAALIAAGAGICLAASPRQRHYSGRFLGLSAVFLASLLGILMFIANTH